GVRRTNLLRGAEMSNYPSCANCERNIAGTCSVMQRAIYLGGVTPPWCPGWKEAKGPDGCCSKLAPGEDCDSTTPSWCSLSDCPRRPANQTPKPDPVHEPLHYQARDGSAIECIDAMRAMSTPEEFRGYLRC